MTAVGRRYFGLDDNPRLHVITADARPFLRRTHTRYDLIIVDAYRPPYVPFYLATQEFFRLARSRLAPGGAIVAQRRGRRPSDHRLAEGVSGTLATEFPLVLTWQALHFNQFVIGLDRPEPRAVLDRRLASRPRRLRALTTPARRPDAHRGAVVRPVDGRPRARRVDHRPDDPRVRGSRRAASRSIRCRPRRETPLRGDGPLLRIGHRGAAALAPENTIEAVEAALEHGVDHVELDVFAGRDGKLVLGHSRRELADEPVALDEMLVFLAERAPETGVLTDLKFAGKERALVEALRAHGFVERALACTSQVGTLRNLQQLEPKLARSRTYPRGRVYLGGTSHLHPRRRPGAVGDARCACRTACGALVEEAGASAMTLNYRLVTRATVEHCHELGVAVFAWTVNDPGIARRLDELGVDGVITDDPRILTG